MSIEVYLTVEQAIDGSGKWRGKSTTALGTVINHTGWYGRKRNAAVAAVAKAKLYFDTIMNREEIDRIISGLDCECGQVATHECDNAPKTCDQHRSHCCKEIP